MTTDEIIIPQCPMKIPAHIPTQIYEDKDELDQLLKLNLISFGIVLADGICGSLFSQFKITHGNL